MVISLVGLHNFRGFDNVELPLKPLTVLLGPNSAGKSSFGQAIIALKEAHTRDSHAPPNLNPGPGPKTGMDDAVVDLGTLRDLRRNGADGPVGISIRIDSPDASYDCRLDFGGPPIFADSLELTSVKTRQRSNANETQTATAGAPQTILHVASGPLRDFEGAWEQVFSRTARSPWRDEVAQGTPTFLQFRGIAIERAMHETGTVVPLASPPLTLLGIALGQTEYLRPSRLSPGRQYSKAPFPPLSVGADGRFTADFLVEQQASGKRVVVHQPPALPTTSGTVAINQPWEKVELPLIEALSLWLRHLGLASEAHASRVDDRLVRLDVKMDSSGVPRALADVGFGVSQVLPVLAMGCVLKEGATLVLELPEAHLHPRSQAKLADFLCAIVKAGGRLLVETHSESLFHRLRLWAALDDQLAESIGAWLIDPPTSDGACSTPKRLDVSDELRWPSGFLAEGADAEYSIALAREARARAQDESVPRGEEDHKDG